MKRLFAILLSMLLTAMMIIGFTGCDFNFNSITNGDVTPGDVTPGNIIEEEYTNEIYFEELPMILSSRFVFTVENAERNEDIGIWGVNVIIENKSLEPLSFSVDNVVINGIDFSPAWICEVFANETVNGTITFNLSEFEENQIELVETIEFTLNVLDKDGNVINDVEHQFSLTVAHEPTTEEASEVIETSDEINSEIAKG
jgi:hypothetical protein